MNDKIAIKMKTNAGKNIIASPGFFVMGIDEEITMEGRKSEFGSFCSDDSFSKCGSSHCNPKGYA